jgi:hypothetical protein
MTIDPTVGQEEPGLLESPWLRHQVEGHLVFGFFARRVDLGRVWLVVLALGVVSAVGESWLVLVGRSVSIGLLFLVSRPCFRMSRYNQAAIGWFATKVALGVMSFGLFFAGGLVGFFRGQPEAIHLTLLALIWCPTLEFIGALVRYQRLITVGRLLVSVPILVLASRAASST